MHCYYDALGPILNVRNPSCTSTEKKNYSCVMWQWYERLLRHIKIID